MDILSALVFAIGLNLAMFVPAFIFKTDKLTDTSYGITFAALALFGYTSSSQTSFHFVLMAMVLLWAVRLGGYLLYRVFVKGKDARFDGTRENFAKFARFWFLQGLTVAVVMVPSIFTFGSSMATIKLVSLLGLAVFAFGFFLETIADFQKDAFNKDPDNKGHWIESGVWSWSRHPNYLGEIMVWVGVYVYALPALTSLQAVAALISPVYIVLLLSFGSGIPILEKSADDKWGENKEYQRYKKRVGILLPKR